MKTLLKIGQQLIILAAVFAFASMTGNQVFAASATVSVGIMSGIVHTSAHFKGLAFEAPIIPVVPEFTPKSRKEIDDLSDDDYDKYVSEKEAHRTAEIELKFYNQAEAIKALDDPESEANKLALKELTDKMETVIDEHKAMYLMLRNKTESPKGGEGYKTMGEALLAGFMENSDELKDWAETGRRDTSKGSIKIEVNSVAKAVVDMGEENTIGAGATEVTLTENTGLISPIRKRELRYMANVSTGTIGTSRALWIEEVTEQGTPIMLGEGDAKTQLSVLYVEQTSVVKKIAVFGKVTTELLADLPQLVSFIQNNLLKRMDIVLENQLFSGDGVGDNLLGSITQATAFTGGSLAAGVETANEADVIEAIALQAEEAFHVPNCVFVHPSIVAKIRLLKGTDDHYLIPRFVSDDQLTIGSIKVIPTTAVGADVFLGGDCTVINALVRSSLGIQIGLDGNDFTQNKQTMLVEKRIAQFISANDTAGLITGTFTAAKAALETP